MIVVFGSLNIDLIVPVPHLPKPGETVLSPSHAKAPGGKGANQAVAAARAGGEVVMVGCVGRDSFGDELLEIVSAEGVAPSLIEHVDAPTGIAVVTVADDGENQIIVASGANMAPGHDMVDEDLLADCSTVLAQMETSLREVFTLTGRAKQAGKRVILNAAPAGPIMPETLDLLIVNEGEADVVAAELGLEERGGNKVAERLAQSHGITTIVTLGAAGAVAIGPDDRWQIDSLTIQPVDTVGAGDAFCGTLAAALDNGLGLRDALRCGAVAGALACLEHGAMPSLPDAAAIAARLGELAPAERF